MSINSNDFCNRYNEVLKSDKKKMIAAAAACTIVMGAGFGGYLYYGAYYASGWHTHDGSTYYIVKETGEKALGYQIIDNTCYLFDFSLNPFRTFVSFISSAPFKASKMRFLPTSEHFTALNFSFMISSNSLSVIAVPPIAF